MRMNSTKIKKGVKEWWRTQSVLHTKSLWIKAFHVLHPFSAFITYSAT